MKKTLFYSGVICVLLLSCEKNDELTVDPVVPVPEKVSDTIKHANSYAATSTDLYNADKFNLIFTQNFSNDLVNTYTYNDWYLDWNMPAWSNHNNGYGKVLASGTNKYVTNRFDAGAFNVSGGYQWQSKFPKGYNELYFSYKIKFSSGFTNTQLQGKLPGLSGGASNTGGKLPTGTDGWSARYMFHGTGIKFYLYYPEIYKLAGDPYPISGKSYWGQGPTFQPGFVLKPEVWYTVTQRIVMNTVGKADGLVEGFINGKLCAVQKGLRFRNISTLMIDRIYFGNFFGASGVPPSKTEYISFDDFAVYTYSSLVSTVRGTVPHTSGATIVLPSFR